MHGRAGAATIGAMTHSIDRYPLAAPAETVWRFFAAYNELPRITGVYLTRIIHGTA